MSAGDAGIHAPHADGGEPLIALVRDALAIPGSHVNIERSMGRRRLRFKIADMDTGKSIRRGLELPDDDALVASIADIIHGHRQALRESRAAAGDAPRVEGRWRKAARKRLLALCPHGGVVKRRLALVFDIAADLGFGFLEDFLARRPWLARPPRRAGRPSNPLA